MSLSKSKPNSLTLKDADFIQTGDVFLCSGGGILTFLGPKTHAGMFVWLMGRPGDPTCRVVESRRFESHLWVAESVQRHGCQVIPFEQMLKRYKPGNVEVRTADSGRRWPRFNRIGAGKYFVALRGHKYGWNGILFQTLMHSPVMRLLIWLFHMTWLLQWVRPNTDDNTPPSTAPFCSQAVAMSTRIGGHVDPVPYCSDTQTEPMDLAKSLFYEDILGTL